MNRDFVDQLLVEYFQPTPVPTGLARDIIRQAGRAARQADALLDRLAIEATPRGVSRIRLGPQQRGASSAAQRLIDKARVQLHEYLNGQRAFFSLPLDLSLAPAFQAHVLTATRKIPFGEVRPYAWVATEIGHAGAVRAVGTALGRNPVPLIVPCHRVLKSDGSVGGYIFGTPIKQRLLGLERTVPILEGCTSTHIVCRVGCAHAQRMKPENRVVFASVDDARSVGYRACRVCQPAQSA